jgi:hypothetical protein
MHPAPKSCMNRYKVFPRRNRIIEPESSRHAGSNAIRALNSTLFIA